MSFGRTEVIEAPTELPLTVQDVKDYLRIEGNIDDEVVLSCLRGATDWISGADGCGYALTTQKWAYYPSGFNAKPGELIRGSGYNIRCPGQPLADTTGTLKYTAVGEAAETAVSVTMLEEHQHGAIYAVRPAAGWPQNRQPDTPLAIEYKVGHSARSNIPNDLLMAVRLLSARFYENRGSGEVDPGIERIIGKYRRWW